jgi:benzoyl-CoA reductase/2-hydroxyglutaryl-CoA dehydratase subunit BcrC/BadD/HgdB
MGLDGSLAWLDGVVFPQVCDSAQNLPGVWDKNCPSPYSDSLFWAKSLTSPSARGYTIEEVKRFRQGLETYLGEKISDEAIQASIGVYNKSRGLLRQLASHTDKLTCREKYDILKAALLMPKEQFNSLAEKALEVLENKSPVAKERIPLAVSGIMWEPPELLDVFDDLGAVITADDFCTGSRYFVSDVPESGDPVEALVDYHLGRVPFACYHYEDNARADFLKDQVKKGSAKGLVFLHMKFCDPEDYDYPDLAAEMKKENVTSIHLETELQTASLAQIRTRLEAFLEMVEGD